MCGNCESPFLELDFSALETRVLSLGLDWSDYAVQAMADPGPTEEPEDDDRMRCDCCDQAFDDGDLNEDQVCADCEEEGRLDAEHVRFEGRSSLFL